MAPRKRRDLAEPSVEVDSRGGRAGPWNKEQLLVIENSLPAWEIFSLVENKGCDGRESKFTKWKQAEADTILRDPVFQQLPDGVSNIPSSCGLAWSDHTWCS
jgi:hypothetical protein